MHRFESKHQPLASKQKFATRVARYFSYSMAILIFSLGVGMAGYHWIAELPWMDSFLNASMILTGMGPIDPMHSEASKLFAGLYALFSGIVFLSVAAIAIAPVAHRLLHLLHIDDSKKAN